jgi:site-specific recombinase XerD
VSIYPEKGRRGYTGVWIVEVRDNGERKKFRTRSYEEAMDIEQGRRNGLGATMGDLYESCKNVLWAGHKDEVQSRQRLARVVGLIGTDKPLIELNKQTIEKAVDMLKSDNVGPKTINRHLAAISRALKWASEAEWIEKAPAMPWQRESEGRKVWLPEHMTKAFLMSVEDHKGEAVGFAVEVLLYTGMRISELLSLSPADVDQDTIHLTDTKTSFPRSLPLPRSYGVRLVAWMLAGKATYRDILDGCNKASETLRISPAITPHALRHTTATRLTAAGVPTLTVAQIMGHRSLRTTQGYTHFEVDKLRSAMGCLLPGNAGETPIHRLKKREASEGIEPPYKDLQSSVLGPRKLK